MTNLDETDRKIIAILRENAREPVKGIAVKTGIARSTVRHRMERLEAGGIITGYRVELKETAEAGIEAFLLVKLARTPAYGVIDAVAAYPEVRRCYSLSGELDLIVEIGAAHAERLNEIRDAISRLDAVANLTTSIVLNKNIDL